MLSAASCSPCIPGCTHSHLQLRINEFSRLNNRKAEHKKDVEKLEKSIQDLDDASEGVLLSDGAPGDVKIMYGESFFSIDSDAANTYIDGAKEVGSGGMGHVSPLSCTYAEGKLLTLSPHPAVSTHRQVAQSQLETARAALGTIDARQRELKRLLYARLGDAINLEEGPE